LSGYSSLAMVYDRLMEVDYSERADYLLSLFSLHGGKYGSLLDLACGSGTLTLELARRGADMVAVDGSEDMLAAAREKAAESGADVLWLCQDMTELDLYGTVEGAVCTLDSLNHLPSASAVTETLRRLSLFVEPKGLLIFDVNTPYKHREVLGDNAFVYEEEDFLCTWRNNYTARDNKVTMWLDIFALREDGTYERFEDEITERAYSLKKWESMLKAAQFTPLAVYGDMTTDAPTAEEQRWVIVARNDTTNYAN